MCVQANGNPGRKFGSNLDYSQWTICSILRTGLKSNSLDYRPKSPRSCLSTSDDWQRHPVSVSIPGAPPASLPDRMIYPFPVNLPDASEYTVRVHFKYGQDEQTLIILAITAIQHK